MSLKVEKQPTVRKPKIFCGYSSTTVWLCCLLLIAVALLATGCVGAPAPVSDNFVPTPITEQIRTVSEMNPFVLEGSTQRNLRFERVSLEQGLSQSTVFSILQDSQGYMWFGTEDGLNKYDGNTFTIYKHDPENPNSLSSNWIMAMLEDDTGVLWIGTRKGGLDRYDRELDQFTHYRNDSADPSSLSNDEVTAIYQAREGELWIGTGSGGLDRLILSNVEGSDQENERFIHYRHDLNDPNSLSSNAVSVIFEDQEGVLWIGTDGGGLNRFDRENESWLHYRNDPSDPHSLSHDNVTVISEDPTGALWVGTGGGGIDKLVLSKAEGSTQDNARFIHYQHDPDDGASLSDNEITAIYQDRDGVLWVGTWSGGLNRFDPEKETFAHYENVPGVPHSLSSNIVLSIFQDREGVLWFGTIGGGVNKLDVGLMHFPLYQHDPDNPDSLGDNMVRAFYHDLEDTLWIGTMFGGLDWFDRQTGNWRHYRHDPDDPGSLSDDFTSEIYRDRSGVLWIGTRSGLDRFNPETGTFTHYQADPDSPPGSPGNDIGVIYESQDGELWLGTKGGIYRFDLEKEIWGPHYRHDPDDPHSLSNDWVFSVLEDFQGRIWIGTAGGLDRFNPETETFTHFQNDPDDPHSLNSNIVLSILQDSEGTLWISTGGGLDRFDPETESFTHYREEEGMPNDMVYCSVEDVQGYLWLSTNKGLSRFDPQRETFRNYDVTDGLQSNEFNGGACYMNDSGEIFFGGIDGFNTFFPESVQDNPTIPPVVLTSLAQHGEEVDLEIAVDSVTDVAFKWPDNSFEFEFAALSFAHPERNQYAYMLDGFDESWNYAGARGFGRYTNLPGGSYTLQLFGSNNDGVWNETGHALGITIVPPVWQTWWFRVSLALLLAGVVFFGYRQRVRGVESRSRELEVQVEERTAELQREIAQRTQIEEALRHSEMEKAVAAERGRLARELHDSVTQSLYSLTLFTEAARHMAEDDGNEIIEQYIGQIGVIGLQALKEMRLLVFELRPPELEKEGLVSALRRRLEAVEGRAGVDARVVVDELFKLPGSVEQEFFRIAQEALNNALKHAASASVVVYLRRENGSIEMEIVDDGVGFDPQSLPDRGGMGLKNIRERAERLGGEMVIRSNPGNGISIKITIEDTDEAQRQGETYE